MRSLTLSFMILISVASLASGLSGCGSKDRYERTPAGWHIHWKENGTITTGLHTKLELMVLFDAAMERSFPECAAMVGLPESYVRDVIHKRDALYTLIDDSIFEVAPGSADAPQATWATGITYGRSFTDVAFYLWRSVDPSEVPIDAPAWTIHPNPNHADKVIYGQEVDGNQYPALGYELHWQFVQ